MRAHHWIMLGLVAIAFYVLGAKFPGLAALIPGAKAMSGSGG
jgi:hypothetical protein